MDCEVELAVGELERAPRGFKLGEAVRVPRHLNFDFDYPLDFNGLVDVHNGWCGRTATARAIASADAALVQHVSVTIAGARGDAISVAHAAVVNGLTAVCDAVTPRAARAVPSAHTACICHISCAVALARGDARAAADLFVSVCASDKERKREYER